MKNLKASGVVTSVAATFGHTFIENSYIMGMAEDSPSCVPLVTSKKTKQYQRRAAKLKARKRAKQLKHY